MQYGDSIDIEELKTSIQKLKSMLTAQMTQLTAGGDIITAEAYKAYLVDQMKRPPEQVISDALDELLFLVNSINVYNDLQQYLVSKNTRDYSVESICRLMKELTGEELLPLNSFNTANDETNALSVQLGKYGLTKEWLITHGLASEQEILRLQQSHNTTGISYKKIKSGIRIDSVELSGNIIIPEFIDGDPVIKLASGAFAKRKDITSVILPQYLLEIDNNAFEECGIISIVIPDNVQIIGERAFFNCRQLERIELPKSLRNIKKEVFAGCSALGKLKIPQGVKTIGDLAFDRCRKLKKVQIPDSVMRFGYGVFSNKATIYCTARTRKCLSYNHLLSYKFYDSYDEEN